MASVRRHLPKVGQCVEIRFGPGVVGEEAETEDGAPSAENLGIERSREGDETVRGASRPDRARMWYRTKVEWIGEKSLWLLAPMEGATIIRLTEGTSVEVRYFKRRGVFRFISKVLPPLHGEGALVSIAMPARIEKLNKRRYCRVEASLPVKFWLLDGALSTTTDLPGFKGLSRDVGAGGVCLETVVQLTEGTPLRLEIDFGERVGIVNVNGRVSWCRPVDSDDERGTRRKFLVAVGFVGVERPVEDAIMGFVFRREAHLRKIGLI